MKQLLIYISIVALIFSACKKNNDEQDTDDHSNPFMKKAGAPALIVAHRGGAKLAPENTLAAFDNALALGVDVLEMDVCLTKDNVLVAIHDLTIDRTCEASGNVRNYTFDELRQFNFAYNFKNAAEEYPYRNNQVLIPHIEEIFERYPNTYMMI